MTEFIGEGSVPISKDPDPVPKAAEAAKPMIEGVPTELGGNEVRQAAGVAEAERLARIASNHKLEAEGSIGPSTVRGKVPQALLSEQPPTGPPSAPTAA